MTATIAAFYEHLTGVVDHQPWRERAACKGMDAALFVLARGDSGREAKRVCRGCEVRAECLEYALDSHEQFGVWGGTSERERRRMRREGLEVVV